MDVAAQQIIVTLLLAALLLYTNLKAGSWWLKMGTLWAFVATLAFAAYLVLAWVFW